MTTPENNHTVSIAKCLCLMAVLSAVLLTVTANAGTFKKPPTNSKPNNPKNVLFIAVEDLRPELASFGASYIHSPNIDQLAKQGTPSTVITSMPSAAALLA